MAFFLDWVGGPSLPILDTYTVGAAYSTRKLRTAYGGSAIRVRRSSDNTEQDIGFDGSGDLDTSALTSFVGANNGFVVTWYDQSGNARNATTSTAARQPQIVSSGTVLTENSRPTVLWDGSDDLLTASAFAHAQGDVTSICCTKAPASSAYTTMWSESSSSNGTPRYLAAGRDGADAKFNQRTDANITTDTVVGAGFFSTSVDQDLAIYSYTDDGSNWSAWKDNTSGGSPVAYTRGTTSCDRLNLGAYWRTTLAPANVWVGSMSEIIIATAALSDTDRQAIQSNMASYFGVTLA